MKVSMILDHSIKDFQGTDDGLVAQRREEERKIRRDEETTRRWKCQMVLKINTLILLMTV